MPRSPSKSLRDIRAALGLSQRAMARELGITQSWLAKLERGHAPVSRTILLAAQGLRCATEHR